MTVCPFRPMGTLVGFAMLGVSACTSNGDSGAMTTASAGSVSAPSNAAPFVGNAGGAMGAESGPGGTVTLGAAPSSDAPDASGGNAAGQTGGASAGGRSPGVGVGGAGPQAQGGTSSAGMSNGGTPALGSGGVAGAAVVGQGGAPGNGGAAGNGGAGGNAGASGHGGDAAAGGAGGALLSGDDFPDDDGVARWHHVHLNAMNPAASIDFYTTWFASEAAVYAGTNALWTQESWVLFEQVTTPPETQLVSSIYHIGWTVLDVNAAYEAMVEAGVPFDTPLTDISTVFGGAMGADFAYAEGPDGELIEFYQANAAEFMHLHFVADDPVGTGEWYQEHFGATRNGGSPSREPGFVNDRQIRPNMNVTIDAVGVWWYPTGFVQATYPDDWAGRAELAPQRGRAIDHFALSVNNLPQVLERLEAQGIEILEAPAVRMNGAFISAFVQAPDGVELELVQGHAMLE